MAVREFIRAMLISAVNVSEGRQIDILNHIAGAASRFCFLLDVHSDADHNRSVLTLAGETAPLIEGIIALAEAAMGSIDLAQHRGVHPRLGAIDVIPFCLPPGPSSSPETSEEAILASFTCARRIWTELGIPCFFYDGSAADGRITLPVLRKEAFGKLPASFGNQAPHPTAGAVAIGARPALVAYNTNLDSADVRLARRIAADLRQRFPFVRALGLPLPSKGCVQVSCNLIRPTVTTIRDVFEAVTEMARDDGESVLESEVAGLAPRQAFGGAESSALRFSMEPKVLEDCLKNLV